MSKVAFVADIHFGVSGKLEDICFACRVIREYCHSNDIDTIVVLGDMFHDRRHIGIDVLSKVSKFFEEVECNYDQQWITFPGNHDMFLRHSWDINSLQALNKHLMVVEDIKILQLDNQRFWILPFIQYEKAYMNVVNRINHQVKDGDKLLTHIGINNAVLNTCFLLKDWSIVNFKYAKFDKIYTGHFHSQQQVGDNIWYPGSPIPFKFDEGDVTHGFLVYDTVEDTHISVDIWDAAAKFFPDEIPPPQFRTIHIDDISELADEEIYNNMIRIALDKEYSEDDKRMIKQKLLSKEARVVRWLHHKQKLEANVATAHTKTAEYSDLFKSWVSNDDKNTKDLDLEFLKEAHLDVIRDGDDLYNNESDDIF